MLSEKEKDFARELLERIELEDLITLTDTVTNRAVTAENRKGKGRLRSNISSFSAYTGHSLRNVIDFKLNNEIR